MTGTHSPAVPYSCCQPPEIEEEETKKICIGRSISGKGEGREIYPKTVKEKSKSTSLLHFWLFLQVAIARDVKSGGRHNRFPCWLIFAAARGSRAATSPADPRGLPYNSVFSGGVSVILKLLRPCLGKF